MCKPGFFSLNLAFPQPKPVFFPAACQWNHKFCSLPIDADSVHVPYTPRDSRRPDRLPMCRVDGHANVRASMFVIFLVGCQVCFPTQSHFANCFAELLLASKEPHAMWSHFANCFFESLSLTVTQCSGHLIRSLGTARPSHGIRCSATTTMAGHKAQTVSPYMRVTWGMVEP